MRTTPWLCTPLGTACLFPGRCNPYFLSCSGRRLSGAVSSGQGKLLKPVKYRGPLLHGTHHIRIIFSQTQRSYASPVSGCIPVCCWFFFFFYTTRCDTFTHLSSLMGIECSFTNQLSSLLVANAVNWVVYLSPVSFPCLSKSEGGISVLLISLNKITLGLKWKGLWGPDCLVKARHGMNH